MATEIGKIERETNTDTAFYTRSWYITPAELTAYTFTPLSTVTWTYNGNSISLYVWQSKLVASGSNYIITVRAGETLPPGAGSGGGTKFDTSKRKYDKAEILMKPSFFGIVPATQSRLDAYKKLASGNDMTDIYGKKAVVGSWVYTKMNFNTFELLPDFAQCPFSGFTNSNFVATGKNSVNLKLPVDKFIVEYYTSKSINNFHSWVGTNGSFGGSETQPWDTGSGKWLALKQDVEEVTVNNNEMVRVVRSMIRVPEGGVLGSINLTWDTSKTPTWDW